ncbi:MAG: hypothetical protein AB7G12_00755 [Thermoanaerobaculia bacterium]
MTERAICLTVGRQFRAAASLLIRSLRRHHPEVAIVVLASRRVELERSIEDTVRRIDLEPIAQSRSGLGFRYGERALAIALKPQLLLQVLETGCSAAIHLDADMLALAPLDELFAFVDRHAVTLTPHSLSPQPDSDNRRELGLLRSGVFNGGVIGVTARPAAVRFLEWWRDHLEGDCRLAPAEGLHDDQRWLDLVPGAFEGVGICRDPGVNMAYWNLRERGLVLAGDGWRTGDGGVAKLAHFSGFDANRPDVVTRHDPTITVDNLGVDPRLFREYANWLQQEKESLGPAAEYEFERFTNGVPIPAVAREIFHRLGDGASVFGDPFRTDGESSYFDWLRAPATADGTERFPSRLWIEIWNRRRDLQIAFPEPAGAQRENFLHWARTSGRTEHQIDPVFLP